MPNSIIMPEVQNLTIIVPLFNEAAVFPQLVQALDDLCNTSSLNLNMLLVDDGSTDATPYLLQQKASADPRWTALFLTRNFGHARAITAGLANVPSDTDAVFILDADLQDPPGLLPVFVEKMNAGADVVYGVRQLRKEGFFKRACYKWYYRLQQRFSQIHMPLDAGDFCLLRKPVVDQMNRLPEESRYMRGLRSWVGFKQEGVAYERAARAGGSSKYSYRSLFRLASNGLFNFSELPIRFIGIVGLLAIIPSLIYLLITLYKKLVYGTVPEGFTSLIFAIVLFSGVQLLSLGIIGEYVLRIFFQVKQRPLYLIKSRIEKGVLIHE